MAEFAAKVRARFRRRHSAMSGLGGLPAMGVPSLLSRSSARSSSGSHGSSGSTTNTTAVADFGSRPESRHRDRDRDRDRGAAAEGGLAAAAVAADDQHDDKGATVAHEPQNMNDIPLPNDNNNNSSCDIPPGSSSGLSSSLSPAHPDIDIDNININNNINGTAVKSTDTPATAATTSITATPTTGPASAPALPEATEAQRPTALATGPSPAGPDDSSDNSDMAAYSARTNNNQQLLPSIHEQELLGLANADADADAASSHSTDLDPAHLLSPQARYKHHLSHLHNSQLNPNHQLHRSLPSSQLPSPLSVTAPASPSKKYHHNHHQRPRTPKNSAGRPLHIALPPASFGPPSNLSPNSIYSASATAAPSSPLGRYSSTLSAATTAQTLAPTSAASALPPSLRSRAPIRRQSLVSNRQSALIQTLLQDSHLDDVVSPASNNHHHNSNHNNSLNPDHLLPISASMVTRKIWVKRPGGSATLVTIHEDDVVDDVRDMVLRKYANSLGRQFDAPDITLRIRPGSNQQERILGPEEPMARTLDAYFPTGQTVDDALIIDVPLRRTPRASPRAGPPHAPHIQYYVDDSRPLETANDYFGPGAISTLPVTVTAPSTGSSHPHAISILSTGQVPQIPSPGSGATRARNYRERPERPRLGRQHTSSPTLINMSSGAAHQGSILAAAVAAPHGTQPINLIHHSHTTSSNKSSRSRTHSEASEHSSQVVAGGPQPPPLPTPPGGANNVGVDGGPGGVPGVGVGGGPGVGGIPQRAATPPPRVSSPRPSAKPKKKRNIDHPALPKGMLNGSVPPINVLIVEDNIINLKLLEAFVKRLKVRWSTAMNGRDAVNKWRNGGFHLVLMDIQLPVMSGLDATREIRRLERVNSIGVFSSAASTAPEEVKGEPDEKDKLGNMDLFKSPVIIVALTASSLQSDRHEALAAGCNDFLTKPVNFVWLERKVMEWGCMQALIDFDGWRQWKDFAQHTNTGSAADDKAKSAVSKTTRSKKARSGLAQAVSATA